MSTKCKRAVGVIRVSQVKGREGDSFHSPATQRERIEQLCAVHGWRLVGRLGDGGMFAELDVSGAKPLAERPGLLAAVEAIEAGRADVLVAAYFDRLTRSPRAREELLDRIEAAGGEVWAADMGRQSNGTAAQRFTGGVLAEAARFVRDSAAEKARAAQVEAVEAGIYMGEAVPPGYVKGAERRLVPDENTAPVMREAFELRASGASIEQVRLFLAEHGIERTYGAVSKLLRSRVFLGEVRFGELRNPTAHEGIIALELWERANRSSAPRGPIAKSERLLARLGVLRCGCCGSRMSVTISNYRYPAYRCGQRESCDCRQTISAPLVEQLVTEHVREALVGIVGTASAVDEANEAAAAFDQAQAAYDAAMRVLEPLEAAAVERLAELRAARDAARERHEDAAANKTATEVAVSAGDWELLTAAERRELIRAVIERAEVHPGRGSSRVRIERRATA